MHPPRRLIVFFLALCFNRHAYSQDTYPNGERSDKELAEWEKRPNATGSWPFYGVDVSVPMLNPPDPNVYGEGNGWSFDIVSGFNVSGLTAGNNNPTKIRVTGPENAFEVKNSTNASADYNVCMHIFRRPAWSVDQAKKLLEDKEGSCNGVVSDQCLRELKQRAESSGCRTGAFDMDEPESCRGVTDGLGDRSWTDLTPALAKSVNGTKPSIPVYISYTIPLHESTNSRFAHTYDEAMNQVFMMLLAYKYDDGRNRSDYSAFRCIHANNIAEGSREPGIPAESWSNRLLWSFPSIAAGMALTLVISLWT
ncbi:uncharacterized protein CTRU02_211861 [Colletotrichum truncatum]|uniref:Uncharacterized protein n=1 Tax=Colletotrichum truncatum TaxID=5467 RepID=A0ACC3YLV2_COLTU|nr:uncharacterized protein CTRU02_07271 [Colletotrichum truncatum]KAF6791509.1 hypothetical protein CTRU02_07271 [Colletotrichum truncatum]